MVVAEVHPWDQTVLAVQLWDEDEGHRQAILKAKVPRRMVTDRDPHRGWEME